MKILIWLCCALIYGIVVTALSFCGVAIGGLPSALLAGLFFWLARFLCKRAERRSADKKRCTAAAPLTAAPQHLDVASPPSDKPVVQNKPMCVVSPTVLLASSVVVLLLLNIVQYSLHKKDLAALNQENMILAQTASDQREEYAILDRTVSSQKEEISDLQHELSVLSDKAYWYDEICNSLAYGNFGYASDNFKADKGIVVVELDGSEQKFTLTAHWQGNGTVSYTSDSVLSYPPASISFDNYSWHTSTTITIRPNYKGIVTYTFTNNVNSEVFKVLIVVT